MLEIEKSIAAINEQILKKQENIRSATVGFHPPEDAAKTESLKKEIENLNKQKDEIEKKKVNAEVDIENMGNEKLEKLEKEMGEIKEKGEKKEEGKKEEKK